MSDLIDRQVAITAICEDGTWLETWQKELVMCRNCKHFDSRFNVCHNQRFGDGYANYPPPSVNEEFYCKDGEKGDMSKEEIAEEAIRSAKSTMLWILKELPSAEPEIVRCKDCKYYNPIGVCIEMNCAVCEDSFCCWAERKENG